MSGRLQDKVCLVTGGAGSIGLATARLFLAEGAHVMLADVDTVALQRAVEALGTERTAFVKTDVTRSADVQSLFADTVARFGKLDVLFSNAGNMGVICPLAQFPEEVFDQVMAVHVKGAFLCCKHGLPVMNDGGSVIITSSIVGVRGDPGPYAYIAAKHAQVGLMRSVAKEAAGRAIRVNTLHPGPLSNAFQREVEASLGQVLQCDAGPFLDGMIPLRRHGTPEEVAQAALFLATSQSSFVTGSLLMVDGGMSA